MKIKIFETINEYFNHSDNSYDLYIVFFPLTTPPDHDIPILRAITSENDASRFGYSSFAFTYNFKVSNFPFCEEGGLIEFGENYLSGKLKGIVIPEKFRKLSTNLINLTEISKEIIDNRILICSGCPFKVGDLCGLCGCDIKEKADHPGSYCPDNPPRWSEYKSEVRVVGKLAPKKVVPVLEVRGRQKNAAAGNPFHVLNDKFQFISSEQMQIDIKTLMSKIPSDITAIAGVARSGLCPATMLAMYLHLPLINIRQGLGDVIQSGNGYRLGGNKHIKPMLSKVLVVDDTVMTGNSFMSILPIAKKHFKSYLLAAIYVNPLSVFKPDIWAVDLPWPHLLEWNLFNSVFTPSFAVDFDGILCKDAECWQDDDGKNYTNFILNATPLYLCRKDSIPLVVTARIEKYRVPTLAWLDKWGIKVNNLIMHPAKTLRERELDNIPVYKARHYKEWIKKSNSNFNLFIESEDLQAKEIAKITKKPVLCPRSGVVY